MDRRNKARAAAAGAAYANMKASGQKWAILDYFDQKSQQDD